MIPIVNELFNSIGNKFSSVSKKAGVDHQVMRFWKSGERNPRLDLFIAVANAAGYEVKLVAKPIKYRLTREGAVTNIMADNKKAGYVEDDILYAIGSDGYADKVDKVNHSAEYISKLKAWKDSNRVLD